MQVKIKKLHPDAVIPKYAKAGDAGLDLTATEYKFDEDVGNYIYKTGIAVEIPEGYAGLIFPRSSVSGTSLVLANSVGLIDSGYRGELIVKFKTTIRSVKENSNILNVAQNEYKAGDRIAQLVIIPIPKIELIEVDELIDSNRGNGGFGSTGA